MLLRCLYAVSTHGDFLPFSFIDDQLLFCRISVLSSDYFLIFKDINKLFFLLR